MNHEAKSHEREALSEHLFSLYDHGTSPNALREADSILEFLAARGYRKRPEPEITDEPGVR